ncbi:uncharacterized protein TNCV_4161711 [Trichonephila clavipes]|nr:uncharacterized protein TNCV_4161711 [Trichonephila clavipes]
MECVKRESCPICNGSHHFSICFRNRHDDDLSPKRDTDNIVSAVIKTDSEDILTMSVIVNEYNISKQLSEFWNLENLGIEAEVSDEENIDNDIMSEFEAGISYQNKRYKVKFPWKPNMKTLLENNEEIARKRFLKLRSRFKNDSSLFEDYKLVNPYLMENQLVLLKDPNTKPLDWPMGRILEVFPGSDGLVRVVNVKTSTGILKRAITKVVPLPIPVDPATVEKNN